MFAGEPGPANLSPRTYPSIDSSAFHALTPALITHLDHAVQVSRQKWKSYLTDNYRFNFPQNSCQMTFNYIIQPFKTWLKVSLASQVLYAA